MIFEIEEIHSEGLSFEVLEPNERFCIDSSDCFLTEGVKIRGKLEKSGAEVICQAWLETSLSVVCTRCLVSFDFPVKGKLCVYFKPRPKNHNLRNEVELSVSQIEQEYYEEGRIDISNPSRDLILLSLPQVTLCRENCAGLCPQCGINLNESNCDCKVEGFCDPRLAVLEKLKDKMK